MALVRATHSKARVLDLTTNEYSVREEQDGEEEVREPERPERVVHDIEESITPPTLFRKALHGPFKHVDLAEGGGKKKLIAGLTMQIPLNELDLPLYFYRPDLLDDNQIYEVLRRHTAGEQVDSEMRDISAMLDASGVQLDYYSGYPSLPNGKPFWEQMEFETTDAYIMFAAYLQLDGLRKLSELTSFPMHFLQEFYHTHYWLLRARAFDIHRMANSTRLRLNRMLNTEDTHYKMADKVLKKLSDYFDSVSEDDLEALGPDKVVAMFEKLAGIQRVSIGLPKHGESKEKEDLRVVQSPQQLIAQSSGASQRDQAAVDESFEDLLEDPESIALAQDLILRRQASGNMD